jgi:hypothetical protein
VKLQIHVEAEAELAYAAEWYDERRRGLGYELLAEVETVCDILLERPEGWPRWPDAPRRDPPIRRVLLRRFPFALAYKASKTVS